MKVIPDLVKGSNIGLYLWHTARNLQCKKRNLRLLKKLNADKDIIEFARGEENEAHNRYNGAKEWFAKEIEK
jgi:hypothetical protein